MKRVAEVWLDSNRRAARWGLVPPGLVLAVGLLLAFGVGGVSWLNPLAWLAAGLVLVGALGLAAVALLATRPRVAYANGELLLYVRPGTPWSLPIEVVEGFLLGQGPALLPGSERANWETSTLVIKLAERYPEWEQRPVDARLAGWCHHYVTLRGTWCEPLSVRLVERLNARLAEVAPRPAMRGGR